MPVMMIVYNELGIGHERSSCNAIAIGSKRASRRRKSNRYVSRVWYKPSSLMSCSAVTDAGRR